MIGRMFKPPKNQRFQYRPKYYDPVREELNERMGRAKKAKSGDKDAVKARISKGLHDHKRYSNASNKASLRSTIMVLCIALLLAILGFSLLKFPSVQAFFN